MRRAKDTYYGKRLLETFSLDSTGTWDIYGEDPNCDMGGPHHTPFLQRVSGRLEDVFAYAETLPSFWQWGAGGEIKPYKETGIKEIPRGYGDDAAKREREEKTRKIEQEIEALKKQLKEL